MDKLFELETREKLRFYGQFFTPIDIFERFIFPEIKDKLYEFLWVDLYAGEGNLIFPILEHIPFSERADFFEKHIRLYDIQDKFVELMINKAVKAFGIPEKLARKNIKKRDNLLNFPKELTETTVPVYHITNPPYLYIGYIKKQKEKKYKKYLDYFQSERKKLQDLYQVALFNDMKAKVSNMVYIIPTNFIYGKSGANEIRRLFFPYYTVDKAYIIEDKIFENTGVNIGIFFFRRKERISYEPVEFEAIKIFNGRVNFKRIILKKEYNYLAGNEFEEYILQHKSNRIKVDFYLMKEEVLANPGDYRIVLLNANKFNKFTGGYEKETHFINERLYKKIKSNILWVRTVDTGSPNGRAGIYLTEELGVDGILTEKPYRTHPIQIFFEPSLTKDQQIKLKEQFNKTLEHLRKITDSEFMTTYKYSKSEYTRKYLGLTQVKKLISTIEI